MLGKELDNISAIDGCVIFDNDMSRHDQVLAWWKRNKTDDTCLSEAMIRKLYL